MSFATLNPSYARGGLFPWWTTVAPPIGHRLVGDARMITAVGETFGRLATAEGEVGITRIADRPAAAAVIQLDQRTALTHRNDILHHLRFGREIKIVDRRQRGIAAHRRANAQHGVRARLARSRGGRRDALGTARQAQSMDLSNHRVAGHAAEFVGDLACRKPVRPEFLQEFNTFVGPRHAIASFFRPPLLNPSAVTLHASRARTKAEALLRPTPLRDLNRIHPRRRAAIEPSRRVV